MGGALLTATSVNSDAESTAESIVDACMQAIAEHGLQNLQMNQVIETSGYSRRTVYKYYSSKAELIQAAYWREGARLYAGAREAVQSYTKVEDIFVYSFLYVYQNLLASPLLSELIYGHRELLENLAVESSILETLQDFDLTLLFVDYPDLQKDIYDLSGYWIQAIISFLLLRTGEGKSLGEVERYVRKRFVPGLCLSDYNL